LIPESGDRSTYDRSTRFVRKSNPQSHRSAISGLDNPHFGQFFGMFNYSQVKGY
jgi:hypothetical protein